MTIAAAKMITRTCKCSSNKQAPKTHPKGKLINNLRVSKEPTWNPYLLQGSQVTQLALASVRIKMSKEINKGINKFNRFNKWIMGKCHKCRLGITAISCIHWTTRILCFACSICSMSRGKEHVLQWKKLFLYWKRSYVKRKLTLQHKSRA